MMIYFVIYILSILVTILSMYIYNDKKNKKNKDFKEEENLIMQNILDLCIDKSNCNFSIEESTMYICEVLRNYYEINYCTIFENKDERLNILSSNIENIYKRNVEEFCNIQMKNIKGVAKINYSDTYLEYESAIKRNIRYSYFIPLGNVGALYLENITNCGSEEFEKNFFKLVVKNIAMVMQTCIYHEKIKELAMKDNLTKMYNRNYMNMDLSEKVANNKICSIAIMDIDHFKNVNDTYGHDVGDIVLKETSKFVKNSIRNTDEVYRFGGEEFIIYLECNKENAFKRLNEIRSNLEKYKIIYDMEKGLNLNITASFGIVENFLGETENLNLVDIDRLIKEADNALYESKNTGRNKITVA